MPTTLVNHPPQFVYVKKKKKYKKCVLFVHMDTFYLVLIITDATLYLVSLHLTCQEALFCTANL